MTLFDDLENKEKDQKLEKTIDLIQEQYGTMAIQKATSLLSASRVAERSQLIGEHSASTNS